MSETIKESERPKDVNGLPLYVGEEVYYARKHSYSATGQMIVAKITKIRNSNSVMIGRYMSTDTEDQVAKVDKSFIGNL